MSTTMNFSPGSLVSVRGRDWIVLPDSTSELLLLRPIDGAEEESTGILTEMEEVTSATFAPPRPDQIGDHRSCGFLRDAMRLGLRSAAGPFRCFGRIAVDPRPYQLVPLLLAMKQDPVRLLIADDVGIGKTVEASLIVRELLDRGEIRRFCVLCPPYLVEQWEEELHEKFHLDAKPVLTRTAGRLERECGGGESIFDVYPYTVVSIDFIKSDRRRTEFLRSAPELVVIDEAHATGYTPGYAGARHQRHQVAARLCQDSDRHMIFVTATPHSGKKDAFRSLLGFLNPAFSDYPDDLSGDGKKEYRREIAKHLVQRRRADIRRYLDAETVFPERETREEGWSLSPEYKDLFDKVIDFTRGMVDDDSGNEQTQRVRWWSALSLLRSLASSPAATKETLLKRNQALGLDPKVIDQMGDRMVLDLDLDDEEDFGTPMGADCTPEEPEEDGVATISTPERPEEDGVAIISDSRRRKLREFAKTAESLYGEKDTKMKTLVNHLKGLVKEGFFPIVFCRFIPTVDYLCEQLRERLPKGYEVVGVSGLLPPEERERRIEELSRKENRILVCTDCLSEGINLQHSFNAVIHYDLSWNPTRHEQREGRVDRFGQSSPKVRVMTFYGRDNFIDGLVLEILIRKHENIRKELGVSVPVPANAKDVLEAIFSGLRLRRGSQAARRASLTRTLPGMDEFLESKREELDREWKNAAEWEKRSRTMFAQDAYANRLDEIGPIIQDAQTSVGSEEDVRNFVLNVLRASDAKITRHGNHHEIDLTEAPENLRDYLPEYDRWNVGFSQPVPEGCDYVSRTDQLTEKLAEYVKNHALDPLSEKPLASRCGVIRTDAVGTRTTLLLLRERFQIIQTRRDREYPPLLAEEVQIVGFAGSPSRPEWLPDKEVEKLLRAKPTGNIPTETAQRRIEDVLDQYGVLQDQIAEFVRKRAATLKEAHVRVRSALRESQRTEVLPELPADMVGIYVYLPDK